MIYIVMGVSSSGKTFIGKRLANALNIPFYDADDFHSPANIEKMKSGQPLDDQDRWPWLQALAHNMKDWNKNKGAVLACSALKKKYRETLSSAGAPACFIYLKGTKSFITQRMEKRTGHFMPESLLDSQFAALEEPAEAITVEIDQRPQQIVRVILDKISRYTFV